MYYRGDELATTVQRRGLSGSHDSRQAELYLGLGWNSYFVEP
jgi:hypothetical protein